MATQDIRPPLRSVEPEGTAPARALLPGTLVAGWLVMGAIREEPDHVLYSVTLGPAGLPAALKLIDASSVPRRRLLPAAPARRASLEACRDPPPRALGGCGQDPRGPLHRHHSLRWPYARRGADRRAGCPRPRSGAGHPDLERARRNPREGLIPAAITPMDVVLTDEGALVTDPGVGRGVPRGVLRDTDEAVDYLSPEEAMGDAPVRQSAVYSLACLVHHCLTGVPPYPHELAQAVLYGHMAEPPARPRDRKSSLPLAVDAVFETGHGHGARRTPCDPRCVCRRPRSGTRRGRDDLCAPGPRSGLRSGGDRGRARRGCRGRGRGGGCRAGGGGRALSPQPAALRA